MAGAVQDRPGPRSLRPRNSLPVRTAMIPALHRPRLADCGQSRRQCRNGLPKMKAAGFSASSSRAAGGYEMHEHFRGAEGAGRGLHVDRLDVRRAGLPSLRNGAVPRRGAARGLGFGYRYAGLLDLSAGRTGQDGRGRLPPLGPLGLFDRLGPLWLVVLGALVWPNDEAGSGPPDMRTFLLPRSDYTASTPMPGISLACGAPAATTSSSRTSSFPDIAPIAPSTASTGTGPGRERRPPHLPLGAGLRALGLDCGLRRRARR